MSDFGKDMMFGFGGVALLLAVVCGAVALMQYQRLQCIELVADKPAAEIVVICK